MKKNKSKNRKKVPPFFQPLSRSRAIVLSDGALLREKTLSEISLLREKISRSESEIQSEYRHLRSKMEELQEDWQDLMDDHRRWKMRSEFNKQQKLSSPKKRR